MTRSLRAASARHRGWRWLLVVGGLLLVVAAIRSASRPDGEWSFSGSTMGTSYTVRIAEPPAGDLSEGMLADTIQRVLDEIDGAMSTYDPDSELSRFNRNTSGEPVLASPALLAVLTTSLEIGRTSRGALDVTVGGLVRAWGFGPDDLPPDSTPTPHAWESGLVDVTVDEEAGTIRKSDPRVEIDLSAIAKGFGVDEVAKALERHGVSNYLVEVGGEIRLAGSRPGGGPWRVGVEAPDADLRGLARTLVLTDIAVATSGDYRNARSVGGEMRSHFIDPRTGLPMPYRGISVTVLNQRAMVADGWATAMSVLGWEEGLAVAEEEGLAVLFVREVEGALESRESSRFTTLTGAAREEAS